MKRALRHVHFVGIGGSGMSAIASLLHAEGYRVSGSDAQASAVTRRLAALGVRVFIGHEATQADGADVVVTSAAVAADNPEVAAARTRRVPVVPRAVMLAELMRTREGIAVAGTHGKTTTTALVASVLLQAGLDPSFVVGGSVLAAGTNARLGRGAQIVVEADESDASFLALVPVAAVVTNIDADHMDTYGHDLGRLHDAFVGFVHRLPFWGRAVLCSDDAGVRAIVPRLERPLTTYGLGADADVRGRDVAPAAGGGMTFTALRRDPRTGRALPPLPLALSLSGAHNVRNALAAVAVAAEFEVPDEALAAALAGFAGVGRRFERRGEPQARGGGRFTLVDDYGHHPAERAAVLAAARGAFPGRRLAVAFQPHRYTRTRDCLSWFADVLAQADVLWLTEVYAAGEAPIDGADGLALAAAVRAAGRLEPRFVPQLDQLAERIVEEARDGDVVVTMGAGSIDGVPARVLELAGEAP
ncbi:MAG: UDP-N-acetylmuramate--L-alanine ligase [Pseudomonadota bacterium]